MKFTEYIKENQIQNLNDNDGMLVVVDVQKEFSEYIPQGFIEKLTDYCKKFNSVYQIWDSNKADSPSYTFPNEKEEYIKKYGTKFSNQLVDIVDDLKKKFPDAKEGDRFKFKDADSFLVKVRNNHGWFYVNEELLELFKLLKGKKVIVVGGAENECIQDVYVAMKSFGIVPIYNHEYLYSAQTNDEQHVYNPKQDKK